MTLGRYLLPFAVFMGMTLTLVRCGDPDGAVEEDIITEQALALMLSAALFADAGSVSARRGTIQKLEDLWLPSAWAGGSCPTIKSGTCARFVNNSVSDDKPGEYLKLFRDHCAQSQTSERGTWRSYVVTKFPASTGFTAAENCQAALKSGITTDFVSNQKLLNKSFVATYGLGQNGDQQNIWVDSGLILRTIYSDFPSGGYEKEPSNAGDKGGIEYSFTKDGTLNRTVRVQGIHIVGYKRKDLSKNKAPETYIDSFLADSSISFVHWDRTFATEDKGDRKYESGNAAIDLATESAPFVVRDANGDRRIESGVLRIQNNFGNAAGKVSFSRSEVKTHLTFGSATCNCPTGGKLHTTYSRLNAFRFPTDGNGEYDEEDFDFDTTCGNVKVTRWLDGKKKMNNMTVHLYVCD